MSAGRILVRRKMVLDRITGKLIPVEQAKRPEMEISQARREAEIIKKTLLKTVKKSPRNVRMVSIRIGKKLIQIPVVDENTYRKLLAKLLRRKILASLKKNPLLSNTDNTIYESS